PDGLFRERCVSWRMGQVFIENALTGLTLRVDGDGSERLDFTYVDDLVGGICLAIKNPSALNQIFNITYGRARSIQELVGVIKGEFPDVRVESVERDQLMPFRGTLSVKKARDLLGYDPQNPIEIGIPKYIQWYREL